MSLFQSACNLALIPVAVERRARAGASKPAVEQHPARARGPPGKTSGGSGAAHARRVRPRAGDDGRGARVKLAGTCDVYIVCCGLLLGRAVCCVVDALLSSQAATLTGLTRLEDWTQPRLTTISRCIRSLPPRTSGSRRVLCCAPLIESPCAVCCLGVVRVHRAAAASLCPSSSQPCSCKLHVKGLVRPTDRPRTATERARSQHTTPTAIAGPLPLQHCTLHAACCPLPAQSLSRSPAAAELAPHLLWTPQLVHRQSH